MTTIQRIAFGALIVLGAVLIGVASREASGDFGARGVAVGQDEIFTHLLACDIPGVQERVIGRGVHSVVYAGEFAQGTIVPPVTGRNDIFLYVVSGAGVARLGDRERDLRPGDFVAIPKGVIHFVRGVGGPLRAIYFEDQS